MTIECQICKKSDIKSIQGLSKHISMVHNDIEIVDYYNLFYKKSDKEGFCKFCGEKTKFISLTKGFKINCKKCSGKKSQEKCLEKYGVKFASSSKSFREKFRITCLKKYGANSPLENKEITDKIKATCLKKYGVKNPYQNKEIQEKYKQTCLNRYGVKYPSQNKEIQEKIKKTYLEKYGIEHSSQDETVKQKLRDTCIKKYGTYCSLHNKEVRQKIKNKLNTNFFNSLIKSNRLKNLCIPNFKLEEFNNVREEYEWICTKCNSVFIDNINNGKIPRCSVCFPCTGNNISYQEIEISKFCLLYFPNIIRNDRSILNGKELDIYLPDIKLAIEFNGLYWHSELNGKDKYYHLNKTLECEKQNIRLIHIFEDEWVLSQDIVKSILLAKFNKIQDKIYARNCKIDFVDNEIATTFLDKNHLQGSINGGDNIGLFYNDELVYLMKIGKSRYTSKYQYEILRSCGKLNIIIIGGFSKLFNYVADNISKSIVSYADARYFTGLSYNNTILKFREKSAPNYYYTSSHRFLERESRIKYQKHKLSMLLENFNPDLTEWQNMQLNGYDRIWDCGNYVYST